MSVVALAVVMILQGKAWRKVALRNATTTSLMRHSSARNASFQARLIPDIEFNGLWCLHLDIQDMKTVSVSAIIL